MNLLYCSRDMEEIKSIIDSHIPASKSTIMIVDDNPDIVTIVKALLEGKGYNVQSAYSGQEVFVLLVKKKPDLIILDIMMPLMDGLEVLTRLKSFSNTRPIPVVLLTANSQMRPYMEATIYGPTLISRSPSRTLSCLM